MSTVLPEQSGDLRDRPVQVPLPLVPTQRGRFESFLPGPNLAVLQQLAGQVPPGQPVYLWGEPGSGKTHLLQAMAGAAEAQGLVVQWFDPTVTQPWELSAGCGLLVLDGVDAYTPEQQQQAFALCIEAQSQACPWAAAGHLPPVDLPLREDLRSRLAWGQTHALQSLGEDQTLFALELEAERRGIELSADVKRYLISRLSRDLSSLMQLLQRLDAYSLSRARPVTVALLRDMLATPAATDVAGA
ncbi:MAG: DnaA regulatory inactivator Hda [Rubrivivax sp.]|jgi:DnaA family protein|nr:DnaA regulatory inactivator Hda [Rubrivivax sp.]